MQVSINMTLISKKTYRHINDFNYMDHLNIKDRTVIYEIIVTGLLIVLVGIIGTLLSNEDSKLLKYYVYLVGWIILFILVIIFVYWLSKNIEQEIHKKKFKHLIKNIKFLILIIFVIPTLLFLSFQIEEKIESQTISYEPFDINELGILVVEYESTRTFNELAKNYCIYLRNQIIVECKKTFPQDTLIKVKLIQCPNKINPIEDIKSIKNSNSFKKYNPDIVLCGSFAKLNSETKLTHNITISNDQLAEKVNSNLPDSIINKNNLIKDKSFTQSTIMDNTRNCLLVVALIKYYIAINKLRPDYALNLMINFEENLSKKNGFDTILIQHHKIQSCCKIISSDICNNKKEFAMNYYDSIVNKSYELANRVENNNNKTSRSAGSYYYLRQNYEKAEEFLKAIIKANPSDANSFYYYCISKYHNNISSNIELDKLISKIKSFLNKYPNNRVDSELQNLVIQILSQKKSNDNI